MLRCLEIVARYVPWWGRKLQAEIVDGRGVAIRLPERMDRQMKSESDMSEYSAFSAALKKVLAVPHSEIENDTKMRKQRRKPKRASRASRAKD